jgi:hypothetical protein
MCRSLFARCLFCPDLRGFGAVCAFAATLIPKFGGLNMNLLLTFCESGGLRTVFVNEQ